MFKEPRLDHSSDEKGNEGGMDENKHLEGREYSEEELVDIGAAIKNNFINLNYHMVITKDKNMYKIECGDKQTTIDFYEGYLDPADGSIKGSYRNRQSTEGIETRNFSSEQLVKALQKLSQENRESAKNNITINL